MYTYSYFYYYCCIIQELKTIELKALKKLNQGGREQFLFLRQIQFLKIYKLFSLLLIVYKNVILCVR